MKRITGVHFIKPLIHPPIYKDESPLGYLVRVAELNRYSSFRWLNQGTKMLNVGSSRDLYSNLASAEWTKCDLDNVLVKDVFTAEKMPVTIAVKMLHRETQELDCVTVVSTLQMLMLKEYLMKSY